MTRSVLIVLVVTVFVLYSCEAQQPGRCRGGRHDVRVQCGSSCEPSCSQPEPLVCTANCIINACRCEQGFVRRETDQRCVPISQCRFRPNPIRPLGVARSN